MKKCSDLNQRSHARQCDATQATFMAVLMISMDILATIFELNFSRIRLRAHF